MVEWGPLLAGLFVGYVVGTLNARLSAPARSQGIPEGDSIRTLRLDVENALEKLEALYGRLRKRHRDQVEGEGESTGDPKDELRARARAKGLLK